MMATYNAAPDRVDIDVPSPREWGKVRNHIRKVCRGFKDLPCHTIWTAGLDIDTPEGLPSKFSPNFSGKLKREVPGFADIVGYLKAESDGSRTMQVQGTPRVAAKDRTHALGSIMKNPTLSSIWDIIEGAPLAPETEVDTSKEAD